VATRFWPKFGCDWAGHNCTFGASGGPAEYCVLRVPGKPDDYSNCAPPLDSKFEATFAATSSTAKDVVDMSLVDGYSLPFKLETTGGSCMRGSTENFTAMDCSKLTVASCPKTETIDGQVMSLQAVNPKTKQVAGCYSPCMKLTDDKWTSGNASAPDSEQAAPYCCAGSKYGSPTECSAGPILQTQYLAEVRKSCPAAYGYAFDDKTATIACSTSTEYKVTFYCPTDPTGADDGSSETVTMV